jgi:carbonic anhydrase
MTSKTLRLLALAIGGLITTAAVAEGPAHWSYQGSAGPAKWGDLELGFETCRTGKYQSPIDIQESAVTKADLAPIQFEYKPSPLAIIDNGHTIQVNYAPGSGISVRGKRYALAQFHFHKPSEEKINGKVSDMVAHLVHRSPTGKLIVIAVLLRKGAGNPLIETLWANLPPKKNEERVVENVQIDVNQLLPAAKRYYTFKGSLTTPPCTEDVTWFVLRDPITVSSQQIAEFGKIYPMNARPVQPLHGRVVQSNR